MNEKIEFGKPIIHKSGSTTVQLYTYSDKIKRQEIKDAFLKTMIDMDFPGDLCEWIYNEYINKKVDLLIETPQMHVPFCINTKLTSPFNMDLSFKETDSSQNDLVKWLEKCQLKVDKHLQKLNTFTPK